MPAGRPSTFTEAIGDAICQRIADGQSVREICSDDDMPHMATFFRWLAKDEHKELREQYVRAKEAQAEFMADEINHIADDGSNDWMERFDKEGNSIGWTLNGEHVQRSKLRIDSRKWLLSKMLPKKYGDKIQTELSGPDGKGPAFTVNLIKPDAG